MGDPMVSVINWLCSVARTAGTYLASVTPSTSFLSDIAAFEAVIIAIAIPVSLEIISRLSDRYESAVISQHFVKETEVRLLPYFLIANILLAIVLRFLVNEELILTLSNNEGKLWRVSSWILLGGFLTAVVMLVFYIRKLTKYLTDTTYVLNKLYREANKYLDD